VSTVVPKSADLPPYCLLLARSAAKDALGHPVSQPEKTEEKGTSGHGDDSSCN
jgi:hypothetical protein